MTNYDDFGCPPGLVESINHRAALDAERALRQQAEHGKLDAGSKGHEGVGGTADRRGSRPSTWRTGRKVGRTIYLQRGVEPSDADPLIGVMDTRTFAAEAVESRVRVSELEQALTETLRSLEQAAQCAFDALAWQSRANLLVASLSAALAGVAETKEPR